MRRSTGKRKGQGLVGERARKSLTEVWSRRDSVTARGTGKCHPVCPGRSDFGEQPAVCHNEVQKKDLEFVKAGFRSELCSMLAVWM